MMRRVCLASVARRMYATEASKSSGINAVKEVRRMTGAGLLDCKRALAETENDIDEALKWLEKRGIAKADKKRGRAAAAGVVTAVRVPGGLVVLEVNSESDFVAKCEDFLKLVKAALEVAEAKAAALEDKTAILAALQSDDTLNGLVTSCIAKTGENITVRRAAWLPHHPNGAVGFYVHNKVAANDYVTSAGITIAAASVSPVPADATPKDPNALTTTANQLSQHVVAESVSSDSKSTPLREQVFMGSEKSVGGWLKSRAKLSGSKNIDVSETLLWKCGDGVEVKQTNFAEEVAQMAQV